MQKHIGRLGLLTVLLAGACAHQSETDTSSNEEEQAVVEQAPDKTALLEQDMGYLSLREKTEKEDLQTLNDELKNKRVPSSDQNLNTDSKVSDSVTTSSTSNESPDLFNAHSVTVVKGDTLASLAKQHLGSSSQWMAIASLNPNVRNPGSLEVGQKIYIPVVDRNPASMGQMQNKMQNKIVPLVDKPDPVPSRQIASVTEVKKNEPTPPAEKPEPAKKEPIKKAEVPQPAAPVAYLPEAYSPQSDSESHDISDLMKEQVAQIRNTRSKGKVKESLSPRRPAGLTEVSDSDTEPTTIASIGGKNLSKIIGILGFVLFITVFLTFLFAKPQKR